MKTLTQKSCKKWICLIYILALFFWSVISGAASASEITGSVCDADNCYVNLSASTTLTSLDKRLPIRENLSARNSEGPETLSAAGGQRIRPLSRSVRHAAADFLSCNSSAHLYTVPGQFHRLTGSVHSLCGIVIINYIHHQDGQKS